MVFTLARSEATSFSASRSLLRVSVSEISAEACAVFSVMYAGF
jgi:hypothetical protein